MIEPYIKYRNLYVIPTFHSRIVFAKLVRAAFFKVYPDLIAVELPDNVREEVMEGIQRLPFLSLIGYADVLNPKRMNFIPIDPGDSIIEGIRVGLEENIPVEFIDFSVADYTPPSFSLPDDHALNQIGLKTFYEHISQHFRKDYHVKKEEIRDEISLEDFINPPPEGEAAEDVIGNVLKKDVLREKYMASHLLKLMNGYNRILLVVGMAHWENIKYFLEHPEFLNDTLPQLMPHKHVKLYNVKFSDARFLLKELPYITYRWLKFRVNVSTEALEEIESSEELNQHLDSFDKTDLIRSIFLKGKRKYEEEFKEFVDLHELKSLFQYSRNLSLVENKLLPDFFRLLVSAKNIVDDDYAWKVKEQACKYPHDDKSGKHETLDLSMHGAHDSEGKFIHLRRRHPYDYGRERDVPLKQRKEEEYPGQWEDEWERQKWNTVSYPPEDIIEEDYFAYLRSKAKKNLKNQRVQIEEFKSSLMDGIDIKETIRNWAFKHKIYVRNEQQLQGKIDTLIVIFDVDDKEPESYPNKFTWWAEHDKESDLALYTTNPGDYLIGPGISHVEIGGILSIFPPPQIQPVFRTYMEHEYVDAKNKAERLLKAGILYSKERYIIYIAEKPPRKYFFTLAGVKNRQIIYLPIDRFSKDSLKTIKHLHILAGKDKRAIAHHYIFLDRNY